VHTQLWVYTDKRLDQGNLFLDSNVPLGDGWVKRQKEVKDLATTRLREGDSVLAAAIGSTRATMVFFTNFGVALHQPHRRCPGLDRRRRAGAEAVHVQRRRESDCGVQPGSAHREED